MPKYTDPEEFKIIRSMYFDAPEENKSIDPDEKSERYFARIKNTCDQT